MLSDNTINIEGEIMDYKDMASVQLYLVRNTDNAKEIDAELDRRNSLGTKSIRFKMIDFEYENNRWDLSVEYN